MSTLDDWGHLLPRPDGEHGSLQHWLWAVPLRNSTHQMGEIFNKIARLYAIGVHSRWPANCNDALVRHYARRCANRPPSVSNRIETQSRRLEAACFMRYALCAASDQLLGMLRHWVQKAVNDATREIDAARPDLKARIRDFATAVKTVALDGTLSRDELRDKLCALADRALDVRPPSRRSLVRAHLMARRGQARAMLDKLVRLPFEAQTAHPVIEALQVLRGLYARKAYTLPDRVMIRLGRAWREAIDSYDRHKALSAVEWATLFALRVALRNGSVYVEHSFAFRGQTRMLIPADDWSARRNHYYGHLKLPQDAKEFLNPLIGHLNQGLAVLRDATVRGDVRIDTAVHIGALSAQGKDALVEPLRRAIFASHPGGQLPEIILEIDSATRFSWLLLGREPRSRSELLLAYAAILALGTSLSAADISRMVPELSSAAIRQMMNRIADERKLRQSADAVLEFMLRHPIAAHLGRADLASSDMMSLETTRTVWQARADPRRRTASIGMYTHVLDRWGIFYDQPIILNERQAGAAIEGVVRQNGTSDVAQLAVDTHGYTDFGMGVARLLGFDLCPRLSHLRDRRLHVPQHHRVPAELLPAADCDVRLDLIESVWDELVRVTASIQSGHCSAVQALTRFGAAARGQPVYEGGVHIGRLFRTVFLIDYFTNPAFRSELQHVLNRGEAVHTVQRAIHIGKIPSELTKHHESLAAVSSSLTLLTNAVMAWNTMHMQRAVDQIEEITGDSPQAVDLRRIAPTYLEGINLRGTFDFPIARYAERVLPSLVGSLSVNELRSA